MLQHTARGTSSPRNRPIQVPAPDADRRGVLGLRPSLTSRRHRKALTLAATSIFFICAGDVSAQTRSATMGVRVIVTRSCVVETRPGTSPQGTSVTCNRGTAPGAVTTTATTTIPAPPTQRTTTTADPVTARNSTAAAAGSPTSAGATTAQGTIAPAAVTSAGDISSADAVAASTASAANDASLTGLPAELGVDDVGVAETAVEAVRRVEMVTINF